MYQWRFSFNKPGRTKTEFYQIYLFVEISVVSQFELFLAFNAILVHLKISDTVSYISVLSVNTTITFIVFPNLKKPHEKITNEFYCIDGIFYVNYSISIKL
jgi:hypothetical protein